MTRQYPWLYERTSPFTYGPGAGADKIVRKSQAAEDGARFRESTSAPLWRRLRSPE